MERDLIKCLFCASYVELGIDKRVKTEVFITPDDDDDDLPTFDTEKIHQAKAHNVFMFRGENPTFQKNLRGFFILKRILNFPQETLNQLLIRNNGEFDPGRLANVCDSCEGFVRQFQEILTHITKLEGSLREIEDELKTRIEMSQDNEDREGNSDWSWIRSEVLGYHSTRYFDEDSSFEVPIIIGTHSTSTSVIPIHYNPEFNLQPEEISNYHDEGENDFEIEIEPVDIEEERKYLTSLFYEGDEDPEDYSPPDLAPPSPPRKPYVHIYSHWCSKCPYKCDKKSRLIHHLELHEEDAGGVQCELCGIYVHWKKLSFHQTRVHKKTTPKVKLQIKKTILKRKKAGMKGKRKVTLKMNSKKKLGGKKVSLKKVPSKPVGFYNEGETESEEDLVEEESLISAIPDSPRAIQRKRCFHLNCPQCPYGTTKRDRLEAHLKVHDEGVLSTRCLECGVFVLSTKIRHHQNLAHNARVPVPVAKKTKKTKKDCDRQEQGPSSSSSLQPNLSQFYKRYRNGQAGPYHYKCLRCPYKSTGLGRIHVHLDAHKEGSGATPCVQCNVLILPNKMTHHKSQQHGRYKKKEGNMGTMTSSKERHVIPTPATSNGNPPSKMVRIDPSHFESPLNMVRINPSHFEWH